MDENLAWLTQKTEDLKSNKGNLTSPPHTVNVIELNCKVIKKVATPPPPFPFLHQPPLFRFIPPFLAKNFAPPYQMTQFLEAWKVLPPLCLNNKDGGVQLWFYSTSSYLTWIARTMKNICFCWLNRKLRLTQRDISQTPYSSIMLFLKLWLSKKELFKAKAHMTGLRETREMIIDERELALLSDSNR